MVLLRRVIGDALRARRQAQHRTLREVSTAANVSLGYLSEIERGQKEASSELLSSICDALGAHLSEVLRDVSSTMALAEEMEDVLLPVSQRPVEPRTTEPRTAEQLGEACAQSLTDRREKFAGRFLLPAFDLGQVTEADVGGGGHLTQRAVLPLPARTKCVTDNPA